MKNNNLGSVVTLWLPKNAELLCKMGKALSEFTRTWGKKNKVFHMTDCSSLDCELEKEILWQRVANGITHVFLEISSKENIEATMLKLRRIMEKTGILIYVLLPYEESAIVSFKSDVVIVITPDGLADVIKNRYGAHKTFVADKNIGWFEEFI